MELEGARIVRLAGTEPQKKIDLSLELGTTLAFDALNRAVYRIVDRYSITQGETVGVGLGVSGSDTHRTFSGVLRSYEAV